MKFKAVCAVLLMAGSAAAQDGSQLDWAGPYAGVYISRSTAEVTDDYDSTQKFSFTVKGNGAGAQLGYNLQHGALVFGLEGSFSSGTIEGVGECPAPTCNGTGTQPAIEIDKSASLRARIGVAHQNMLYFATLGKGFAESQVIDPFQGGTDSQRHEGILASVGIDWKFSSNLSAGAEYLYGRYEDIPYALIFTPDVIGFETRELRLGVKLSF
jgi:outer membrane immunogenic protein